MEIDVLWYKLTCPASRFRVQFYLNAWIIFNCDSQAVVDVLSAAIEGKYVPSKNTLWCSSTHFGKRVTMIFFWYSIYRVQSTTVCSDELLLLLLRKKGG